MLGTENIETRQFQKYSNCPRIVFKFLNPNKEITLSTQLHSIIIIFCFAVDLENTSTDIKHY